MERNWKLKILSGSLPGVEYVIHEGDAVFCVGSRRDLLDGVVGETIGLADNTFYIPDDHESFVFVVRVRDRDGRPDIALGERDSESGAWAYRVLTLNEVHHVASIFFAMREGDDAWATAVTEFVPPHPGELILAQSARKVGFVARRKLTMVAAAALIVAALGVGAYRYYSPAVRLDGMTTTLATAPYPFATVYGRDGRVHVFADSEQAKAWAERAADRQARRASYDFLVRGAERARLGELLDRRSTAFTIIRLDDPSSPEVVLTGPEVLTEAARKSLQVWLLEQMPYAKDVRLNYVSDARLKALAAEGLAAAGVTTRFERRDGITLATNESFLGDAQLNAMRRFAEAFADEWGERRVAIRIRLWDDLLKGRSYEYGKDQLLSVGEGRWEISTRGTPSATSE